MDTENSPEARIVDANRTMMPKRHGKLLRAQHFKGHGLVKARFEVLDGFPDHLKAGVFASPGAFDALIRFSSGGKSDDRKEDAHGMAIKLYGVDGPKLIEGMDDGNTLDFILVDNETFFEGDLDEYAEFNDFVAEVVGFRRNLTDIPEGLLRLAFLVGRKGIRWLRGAEKSLVEEFSDQRLSSPLSTCYWSTTPYALGPAKVKYRACPITAPDASDRAQGVDDEDGLADALVATLEDGPVQFEFFVQEHVEGEDPDIEDPTKPWTGKQVRVATLEILQAERSEIEARAEAMESIRFNPWNTLQAHEPLGAINRVRKTVYEVLSKERTA